VPLSEEELRLLEQMERALVQDDPKLASTLRGTAIRRSARRRVFLAGAGLLTGIAILMAGAITRLTPLGIAGFVVMLATASIGLAAWRAQSTGEPASAPGAGLTEWRERLEDKWRRRKGDAS
jgi:hypothetical protein